MLAYIEHNGLCHLKIKKPIMNFAHPDKTVLKSYLRSGMFTRP